MALCSLSTGRTFTPFRRAAFITASPAMTRISLLATAMSFPASIAASAGRKPPVPTIAMSTMSASGSVASSTSARRRPSPETRELLRRETRLRGLRSFSAIGMRGHADDFHPLRDVARHFLRALADGAGRPEDDDAPLFHDSDDEPQVEKEQRRGEEDRVDQIERAADARQEIAGVFHVAAALDDRLAEVADDRRKPEHEPEDGSIMHLQRGELLGHQRDQSAGAAGREKQRAEKALPRLLRRDVRDERMLSDQANR